MTPRPFQFTLRRMFVSVAYFSAGFALAAAMLRGWMAADLPLIVSMIGPFAVLALMGAGIGQLFGNTWKAAQISALVGGAILYVAAIIGALWWTMTE